VTDHRLPEPVERWLIDRMVRQTPEQRVRTTRMFVLGVRVAGALTVFIVVGQYFDSRLVSALKWPQFLLFYGMAVIFARFLPQVWQNWHDDKFPVIFLAVMVLLMLWMMWFALTEYKGRAESFLPVEQPTLLSTRLERRPLEAHDVFIVAKHLGGQ
jgi:hypothetical protein